ncbi:MAG: Stp1/IreP family PP2C-type Ser/Thr phosphatase [Bacillota bacterium]
MRWSAVTHPGCLRPNNEDALCTRGDLGLFAVADGLGGHRAGEVASRIALEVLEREVAAHPEERDTRALLATAVEVANRQVCVLAQQESSCAGMGTTLSACLIRGGWLTVAHVGDSRVYLLRDDCIKQLTEDHSLVQELVRQGKISSEDAAEHPYRNVISRALGTADRVEVDIMQVALAPGDRVFLCTDGLSNQVGDEEILSMAGAPAPDTAVSRLLEAALARGGPDNITMVLVVIEENDRQDAL